MDGGAGRNVNPHLPLEKCCEVLELASGEEKVCSNFLMMTDSHMQVIPRYIQLFICDVLYSQDHFAELWFP